MGGKVAKKVSKTPTKNPQMWAAQYVIKSKVINLLTAFPFNKGPRRGVSIVKNLTKRRHSKETRVKYPHPLVDS